MSGTSIRKRLRSSAASFGRNRGGNIAPIFAIALVPMLAFVGAAVDYTRANAARSSMQAAMDSAALMVSKDANAASPPLTAAQITTAAQKYFNALYHNKDAQNNNISAVYTPYSNGVAATVVLTGSGTVTTDFMKVAGFPQINFNTTSTATWGNTKLRVAMALDVTGSMASAGKLDAMKKAAKGLIDTLKTSANATGDVYVSIIPFNVMVNVGTTNKNATWLDWEDGNAGTSFSSKSAFGSCSKSSLHTKSACVAAGKTWTASNVSNWSGCVTDRVQSYDTTKDAPASGTPSTLYLAQNYTVSSWGGTSSLCPSSILPMTSVFDSNESDSSTDDTTLKGKINNLTANGNTNQAIGIAWGWQSLSTTNAPIPAPAKDPNYTYQDYMVILSDGLNTQDRWPSYGNGSSQYTCSGQPCIDARQKKLCDAIKADNIKIFTIQVNINKADPTSSILQDCASPGSGNFQEITSSSDIAGAFNNILLQITKLQISE